jgi:hypothetical protein
MFSSHSIRVIDYLLIIGPIEKDQSAFGGFWKKGCNRKYRIRSNGGSGSSGRETYRLAI